MNPIIEAVIKSLLKAVPIVIQGLKDPEFAKSINLEDLAVKPAREYLKERGLDEDRIKTIIDSIT